MASSRRPLAKRRDVERNVAARTFRSDRSTVGSKRLVELQRSVGNRAVRSLLAAYSQSAQSPEPDLSYHDTSNSPGSVVHREIEKVGIGKDGNVWCRHNTKRVAGIIKDHEGDHLTPFIVMQHEIVNSIKGSKEAVAWQNLRTTYEMYLSLPGFDRSKVAIRKGKAVWRGYTYDVDKILAAKGNLEVAANVMLAFRNQIDLSAMRGKKKKGVGHGEGEMAGALHALEGTIRGGRKTDEKKDNVVYSMCMLFDHGRNEGRSDEQLSEDSWKQHCQTVISTYWLTAERFSVGVDDLIPLRSKYMVKWNNRYRK